MRGVLIYLICLFSFPIIAQVEVGQFELKEATKDDIVVCPHSGHTVNMYTPRKKITERSLKSNAAEFIPQYVNVPEDYQAVMEFVFDVASDVISSNVPIQVRVSLSDLEGSVLAAAGPSTFAINFPGATYYNTFYPIALAEKLSGTHINNPSNPDINITIDSEQVFNLEPNNPNIGGMTDLATVLLHELGHGLGFVGGAFVNEDTNEGTLFEQVYSHYLENGDGLRLKEVFSNSTTALGEELTSNNIFFNIVRPSNDEMIKVHAPESFRPGASISHLDAPTFGGTEDRLMTPFISGGDVNYSFGVSENMLYEMGWNSTSIVHEPKGFSENLNEDNLVTARVNSDIGFDTSSFVLHYSRDTFNLEHNTVTLAYDADLREFSFLLEANGEEFQYQYYFELVENGGLQRLVPARANTIYFTYNLGQDTEKPTLSGHVPLTSIKETDISFGLEVNDVADFFTGVDTSSLVANIEHNDDLITVPFEVIEGEFGDFFAAEYMSPDGFSASDELRYQIAVQDKSINKNTGTLPTDGFQEIAVEEVSAAIVSYVNDFNSSSRDFAGSGFSITSPAGFSDAAIHSEHPYRNAGENNTLNFIYELNQLIRIDEANPIIRFDEIVIVETGDEGTTCDGVECTFEFWDYVVVEGKRSGESNWLPFLDAYDSRNNPTFLTAYTNEANGEPSLYRSKTIRMLQNRNFEVGDEIFIRFRLFSDPFSVGWGWAIDNLEIQPGLSSPTLEEEVLNAFNVYPNPIAQDQVLTIDLDFKKSFDGQISLINNAGQVLINSNVDAVRTKQVYWDTSNLPAGLYFAQLKSKDGIAVRKLVVE